MYIRKTKHTGSIMVFTSVCMLFVLICVTNIMSFQCNELSYARVNSDYYEKNMKMESARQLLFSNLHNHYVAQGCIEDKVNFNHKVNIDENSYFIMKANKNHVRVDYYAYSILYFSKQYHVSYNFHGIVVNDE